jgi:ABC-type phosphate transport system substrate-binding protein
MRSRSRGLIAATFILASIMACAGGQDLNGAGATFPYPIYSKWFSDYARETGVRINYQSIGSGGGIRQLTEGTVDFGASDAPMSDAEMAKLKAPVLHLPTVLGAVVVTYNVPGLDSALKIDGPVLADIFLGKVTKWKPDRSAQPGCGPPHERHPGGAPLRRERHHLHLLRLPRRREPRLEERAREGEGARLAHRARRQGE